MAAVVALLLEALGSPDPGRIRVRVGDELMDYRKHSTASD